MLAPLGRQAAGRAFSPARAPARCRRLPAGRYKESQSKDSSLTPHWVQFQCCWTRSRPLVHPSGQNTGCCLLPSYCASIERASARRRDGLSVAGVAQVWWFGDASAQCHLVPTFGSNPLASQANSFQQASRLWGAPSGPRGSPWTALRQAHKFSITEQADGGVGRGPGGPPHPTQAATNFTRLSATSPTYRLSTDGRLGFPNSRSASADMATA